jgi:RHS repeat-associated protein
VIERWQPEVASRLSMVNILGVAGDVGDKYTGLDRFGRVVEQRWTRGTAYTQVFQDRFYYTYDRNGNRLTRTNAFSAAFSETYSYDALNQLQSFARGTTSSPSTTQNWQFDALGNWTAVTTNGVAESRTANAQNELTQVGSAALTYSPTGNLTTDAQGRTLSYDAWNRLVSVQNAASTQVARYEYDGLNRRIVEQTGTLASPAAASAPVRDIYFSRDWQALEERVRTSTGAIPATADTRYLWSPVYVDAMIARDRNADGNTATGTGGLEQRVYVVQDANWNTTAIIAATGVPGTVVGLILSRFIYSPYGDVQVLTRLWETPAAGSTPAVPWSHLFQGLKFTDVTALAYVRHRDYSASLGRFIERDPIGFDAGDNNWYRFVGNGPTGRTDPSGLVSLAGGGWESGGITVSGGNATVTVVPSYGKPSTVPAAPRRDGGDWGTACSNYWYYLTHPWAMDDDLEYGFYGAGTVVIVSGAAAASLGAAGVGTVGTVGTGVNQVVVLIGNATPWTTPIGVGVIEGVSGIDGPGLGIDDGVRLATSTVGRCALAADGPILLNGPIRISHSRWKHVIERHTLPGKPIWEGKSKFYPGEDVWSLIMSGTQQPVTQADGVLVRTWNVGRLIGIDRRTKQPTPIMTVITRLDGSLITAHPGPPDR